MVPLKSAGRKVIKNTWGGEGISTPSLKSAGKQAIKAEWGHQGSMSREPPVKVKGRASIGTQVEAALGHKSIQQVYASRRVAVKPLTGSERGIVVDMPRLKVQSRGGGWARVTYVDPNAKGPVTFSIRMNKIADVMHKAPNAWFDPAEAVYSKWVNTTTGGARYSARRQVEGMLKVATKRGDMEMAKKLETILGMSDEKVASFRKEWEEAHTDQEIEDWYDYEEEEVW